MVKGCKMKNSVVVTHLPLTQVSEVRILVLQQKLKQILMGKLKLGDKVEKVIKAVAPKFHEKKKNCSACARRKARLNKI